ncbi:MAG: aspartate carbamoyltransferase, partial [Eubacteriales bacterium]
MSRYEGIRFVLISPDELKVPDYVKQDILEARGCDFAEVRSLEEAIPELDVLYMTRVQKERFFNEADYVRLKDSYILDPEKLTAAKSDLCIMHPLPRVNEISTRVDDDPRACYFKQTRYGKFVRMALVMMLLGLEEPA